MMTVEMYIPRLHKWRGKMARNVQPTRVRGDAEVVVKNMELDLEAVNKKVGKLERDPQRKYTYQIVLALSPTISGIVGEFISGISCKISSIHSIYKNEDKTKKHMLEIVSGNENLIYALEGGKTSILDMGLKLKADELAEFRIIEPTDITSLTLTLVIEA